MKNIANTLRLLQDYLLKDENFKNYYQTARQVKNLNGFNYFIKQWIGHYQDNPNLIALLDKEYVGINHIIINDNIIDLVSLFIDYKSDLRAYFGLNPSSL